MGAHKSKAAALWRNVMEHSLLEAASIQREVMNKVLAATPEAKQIDPLQVTVEAVQKFQEQNAETNKKMLESIFSSYDTNGDGHLDLQECESLIRDSLIEQKTYAPKLVASILSFTVQQSVCMMKAMGMEEDRLKLAQEQMLTSLTISIESTIADVKKAMDSMMENSNDLAKQLALKMDVNGDGRVSKEEFFSTYTQASSEVVNLNELLASAQKCLMGG